MLSLKTGWEGFLGHAFNISVYGTETITIQPNQPLEILLTYVINIAFFLSLSLYYWYVKASDIPNVSFVFVFFTRHLSIRALKRIVWLVNSRFTFPSSNSSICDNQWRIDTVVPRSLKTRWRRLAFLKCQTCFRPQTVTARLSTLTLCPRHDNE